MAEKNDYIDGIKQYFLVIRELHEMGYELIRVCPSVSPNGANWRCATTVKMYTLKTCGAIYRSNEPPHVFYMSPLCLKAFKQRWYIIGLIEELDGTNKTGNEPRTYALDRVKHLELTDRKFKYPKNFHPQEYFAPHYGVFCGKDYKPEFIRARFIEKAAPYVRTLPLHHSQKEVEPCVFEWYVAPTLDFIQQLRTYSAEMEILASKSLRDKFRQDAETVANLYK